MKIRIIAARVFGEPDKDQSVDIPESGNLEDALLLVPNERPVITEFKEHLCRSHQYPASSFPAVKVGDFYMIWIEERKEWVGLDYGYLGSKTRYEEELIAWGRPGYGDDESINVSGPYSLGQQHLEKILEAYRLTKENVAIVDVAKTSPAELEKMCKTLSPK